jgi:hypothetical protein
MSAQGCKGTRTRSGPSKSNNQKIREKRGSLLPLFSTSTLKFRGFRVLDGKITLLASVPGPSSIKSSKHRTPRLSSGPVEIRQPKIGKNPYFFSASTPKFGVLGF